MYNENQEYADIIAEQKEEAIKSFESDQNSDEIQKSIEEAELNDILTKEYHAESQQEAAEIEEMNHADFQFCLDNDLL